MLSSRKQNIGDKKFEKYIGNMCCSKTPLNTLFILRLGLLTESASNRALKRSNASHLHILTINCKNHNVICYCVMYRLNNFHKTITIHSVWEKLLHLYTTNVTVEWLALLFFIQDVPGSKFGPGTGHPDSGFLKFLIYFKVQPGKCNDHFLPHSSKFVIH
jgi:hypothetical protein